MNHPSARKLLVGFFLRQERSILSRLGSMMPMGKVFGDAERWRKELCADLLKMELLDEEEAAQLAQVVILEVYNLLAAWIKQDDGRDQRLRVARVIYADLVTRIDSIIVDALSPDKPSEDGQFILYRLYDEAGRLLYVGITGRGPQRLVEHYRDKEWFSLVTHVEFERYFTREEVLRREKQQIQMFGPVFNVQHNPDSGFSSERMLTEA